MDRGVGGVCVGLWSLTEFDMYFHAALGKRARLRGDVFPGPGTWCRTIEMSGGSRSRLRAVWPCSGICRALRDPPLPSISSSTQRVVRLTQEAKFPESRYFVRHKGAGRCGPGRCSVSHRVQQQIFLFYSGTVESRWMAVAVGVGMM